MNQGTLKKLLIVDDDVIIAFEKADVLREIGFDVLTVNSGENAIETIKSDPEISLVLMDINLGKGMGGHEAARAILEVRDIPVVFLTSHSEKEIVNEISKIPRYGFVTKDSGDAVLVSSIEMAYRLFESQKRIREGERRYHQLFTTMLEGFAFQQIILNEDGKPVDYRFLEINKAFEAQTGLKASNVIGRTASEVLPGMDEEWLKRYGEVALTGVPEHFASYSKPLGKWFEVSAYQTEPGFFACFFVDISEIRRAMEALQKSEERYRDLYENAPNAYFSVGTDGVIIRCNRSAETLLGYSRDELVGMPVLSIYAENTQGKEKAAMAFRRFVSGMPIDAEELQMRRSDGSVIWVSLTVTPVINEEGLVLESRSSVYDITMRKKAEAALRESEEKFRTAFNTSPGIMSIVSMSDGVFVDINRNFTEVTGYSREEILGKSTSESGIWVDLRDRERMLAELKCRGFVENMEMQFKMKDGRILTGLVSASITLISGSPHILTVTKNIDDLIKVEKERARLVTAIEQSAETIVITDRASKIVYVNPSFEKTTGYMRDEAIGFNPRILKSGLQDDSFYVNMWETLTRGDVWSGRFTNRRKDGSLYQEEATISPVKDESGETVNYVAVKRDITREMSLQKLLLQAQKMKAVGTLAGGIAHDFNNILQIIISFSEYLRKELKEDASKCADIQRIVEAAGNGAELVKGLLTFSRKVEPEFIPLNINSRVQQAVKIIERTFPKMIDIKTELSEDLLEVSADPNQIEQILMNLALNARDAMPDGGRLTFTTGNVTLNAESCRLLLGCSPGGYMKLTVSDTGHGMDKETVEHIFEPFFTTKKTGSGTGLGLAIVYGIVQQHGGFISCSSNRGSGTTFEIYFKALESAARAESSECEPSSEISGSGTILLVDDEESIRLMGKRILTGMGYEVFLAANGREALEQAAREKDRLSLVILDLSMPEMGGMSCIEELLQVIPGIRILIMSGYAADVKLDECLKNGAHGFLGKPFKLNELLQKIRTILDS